MAQYNEDKLSAIRWIRQVNRPSIYRLFLFEVFILGIIAMLALFFYGKPAFYSAILGALLVILPQLYFVRKVFRCRGAKFAKTILKDFYTGEAIKMLLTFSGFAAIFASVRSLDVPVFMLTFVVGQLLFWFSPLLLREHKKSPLTTGFLIGRRQQSCSESTTGHTGK